LFENKIIFVLPFFPQISDKHSIYVFENMPANIP